MALIVEDRGMSRELFQNGDCRIAYYSAIAALVKFLMSGSRESLLQHGWERTQLTQLWLYRRLCGCELMNPITLLPCLPLSEKESSFLPPRPPGLFPSFECYALIYLRTGTQGCSTLLPLPSHWKVDLFYQRFVTLSISWGLSLCPNGCNALLF